MRWPFVCIALVGLCLMLILPQILYAAADTKAPAAAGSKTWGAAEVVVSADVAPAAGDGERIRLLQRRKLGLTVLGIRATTKKLLDEGKVAADDPPGVIAAAVMADMSKQPAWADEAKAGKIDWDAILAFIEKLMPLIMQLIALFPK